MLEAENQSQTPTNDAATLLGDELSGDTMALSHRSEAPAAENEEVVLTDGAVAHSAEGSETSESSESSDSSDDEDPEPAEGNRGNTSATNSGRSRGRS